MGREQNQKVEVKDGGGWNRVEDGEESRVKKWKEKEKTVKDGRREATLAEVWADSSLTS